tara:strand:- start:172 stop:660 length:489 start_codon:yes stop_codon:yes gene_type:complete
MKVTKLISVCVLALTLCSQNVLATDYFFGPENKKVAYGWSSDLNLILQNNSTTTIVLELFTKPSGIQQADLTNQPIKLKIFPAQIMIKPGQKQYIDLSYIHSNAFQNIESYELYVEQLPIHYVAPGARKPVTMALRNYTANILVRPKNQALQYTLANLTARQ